MASLRWLPQNGFLAIASLQRFLLVVSASRFCLCLQTKARSFLMTGWYRKMLVRRQGCINVVIIAAIMAANLIVLNTKYTIINTELLYYQFFFPLGPSYRYKLKKGVKFQLEYQQWFPFRVVVTSKFSAHRKILIVKLRGNCRCFLHAALLRTIAVFTCSF